MLKLRLKRAGKKKSPVYNIVTANDKSPRDGRFVKKLGIYNPLTKYVKYDEDNIVQWMKNGAQMTDAVLRLLNKYDGKSKPLSIPKNLKKPLVALIQKHISKKLEKPSEVTINIHDILHETPNLNHFMTTITNKDIVIKMNLKKVSTNLKLIDEEFQMTVPAGIDKAKLYSFDEIKRLDILNDVQLNNLKNIMVLGLGYHDMTGILKQLKFPLTDAQYKEYVKSNRYLKNAKLPEKKHLMLSQYLYKNNVIRLIFNLNKEEDESQNNN